MSENIKQLISEQSIEKRELEKLTIWVVDDNESVSKSIEDVGGFIDGGVVVNSINNPEDLFRRLKDIGEDDLVFMDGDLGNGMSGVDLVAKSRELGFVFEIVAFSSNDDTNEEMIKKGANKSFTKPGGLDGLIKLIEDKIKRNKNKKHL